MKTPKGKVARLPANIRNQLNEMLYDGFPAPDLIAWLDQQGHPGFNEMNISRWRERGYQAWLSAQERHDHRDFLHELAQQSQSSDSAFHDAGIHLAQLQFFDALNRLEGADLAQMVKDNRKEFIQLLKTFTHFNRYCLQRDRFRSELQRHQNAQHDRNKPPKKPLCSATMEKICDDLNLK
jgi:hypothetical protein